MELRSSGNYEGSTINGKPGVKKTLILRPGASQTLNVVDFDWRLILNE